MTEVSNSVSKKHKGHWSQGLLTSIADPNLIVEDDDLTVTIKDKYPKVIIIITRLHKLIVSRPCRYLWWPTHS